MTSNIDRPTGSQDIRPRFKHVTTACTCCRQRKIKCDAKAPSCSNCQLYNEVCVYHHGVDGRKFRSKENLQSHRAYIQQLEGVLKANDIHLPQTADLSLLGADEQQNKDEQAYSSFKNVAVQPLQRARVAQQESAFESYANAFQTAPSADTNPASYDSNPTHLDLYGSTEHTDGSSPLMDQLAGRMGSLQIAGDGQLRFFGATSNLHILLTGIRQNPSSSLASMQDVQLILDGAGVGTAVSMELENHLLHLYFAWEDPSIHVVDETIFYRERENFRSNTKVRDMYSETLTNAMCAIGAALTPRHCAELPEEKVEFFAARAKALLEIELDSPKLSTVSSLVILSGVEALSVRDSRGWLYSGMAMRVATDLGLHLDTQAYVDVGILDMEDAMLRSTVFWGTFIHERMWSLYMGRPESLDGHSITVLPPSPLSSESTCRLSWEPYIDDYERSVFPALPIQVDEVNSHNVSLCAKMTRIRDAIYSDSIAAARGSSQLLEAVKGLQSELLEWYSSLPQSLQLDEDSLTAIYLPHVLQLHMQYHCLIILANRPLFSNILRSQTDAPSVGRAACTDAAASITQLLRIYRRLYTLRRVNIQAVHLIFTASLIHVYNACGSPEHQVQTIAWRDLEVCCQALAEIGQGYSNATRAREVVMNVKSELIRWNRANMIRDNAIARRPAESEQSSKKRCLLTKPNGRWPNEGSGSCLVNENISQATFENPEIMHWSSSRANIVSPFDLFFWSGNTNNELQNTES